MWKKVPGAGGLPGEERKLQQQGRLQGGGAARVGGSCQVLGGGIGKLPGAGGGLQCLAEKSPNDFQQMTRGCRGRLSGERSSTGISLSGCQGKGAKLQGRLVRTLTRAGSRSLIWRRKGTMSRWRRTRRPHRETWVWLLQSEVGGDRAEGGGRSLDGTF